MSNFISMVIFWLYSSSNTLNGMLLIINTGLWLNKRRQNCEEPKWRAKCPCLTFSIAMSCLDAKISLVPSINSQSHIKDTYAYTTDIRAIFFQNTSKRRNAATVYVLEHYWCSWFFHMIKKQKFTHAAHLSPYMYY